MVSQSVTIAQSSSTSLSRNRCSSAVSAGTGVSSNRCQSGRPEKRSPSHQTVPASIASRSVCDIGGITLRNAASTASLMSLRRSGGMLSGIASSTNASVRTSASQPGIVCAPQATTSATAIATVKTRPEALT